MNEVNELRGSRQNVVYDFIREKFSFDRLALACFDDDDTNAV